MTFPMSLGRLGSWDSLKEWTQDRARQWGTEQVFKGLGFQGDLRRSGELKLQCWKKVLRRRDSRAPYPKRLVMIPGLGESPLSWCPTWTVLHPLLKQNFDELILLDFSVSSSFFTEESSAVSREIQERMVADTLDSLKPHTLFGYLTGGRLAADYGALCAIGKRPISNRLNYSGPRAFLLSSPWVPSQGESLKQEFVESLQKIQGQVRLIWGERDPSASISLHHKDFQSVLIRNAGHSIHTEQPTVLAAVIGQILMQKTPHRFGSRWWQVEDLSPSRDG